MKVAITCTALAITLLGCTSLSVETPDGLTITYTYPALQEKHAKYIKPDGTVLEFDSKSDPLVEAMRQQNTVIQRLIPLAFPGGVKP